MSLPESYSLPLVERLPAFVTRGYSIHFSAFSSCTIGGFGALGSLAPLRRYPLQVCFAGREDPRWLVPLPSLSAILLLQVDYLDAAVFFLVVALVYWRFLWPEQVT
jgi:hypothetical protein